MNNNILNYAKKSLSVTLALALLAISLFTGVSMSTKAATTEKNIIYWDGTSKEPTTTDADGNILIYTAEELHYIANNESDGKSYKVADGIDVMILQPKSSVDAETLMGLADYNYVKTYLTETITATAWCNYSSEPPKFNSSFNGNGVEIYGLYGIGTNVGLFPGIDGGTVYTSEGHTGVTFQNFAVRNSYLESTRRLGVIGAYCATGIGTGTVNVKNCEVSNCYLYCSTTNSAEQGVLVGRTSKDLLKINNCLVYGNNAIFSDMTQLPLYATSGSYKDSEGNEIYYKVENSVVLGVAPHPIAVNKRTHSADCFENVYTDQELSTYTTYADTDIKKISTSDITAANAHTQMPGLDWVKTWGAVEGGIPVLRSFYDGEVIEKSDNTETAGSDTWNGEVAANYAGGDGTEANPFIIENAAQLYKMVKSGGEDAEGNPAYFKVKDGVYDIYANPVENMTSDEIKAYFTDSTKSKAVWDPQTTEFNGNFDGKGVTIHGLYNVKAATGAGVAFLPRVSNSKAFINNVQFSDCYFENTGAFASGTSAAVLVGRSDNSDISFNNVAVCDSTAKCAAYVAAVFVAQNGATVTIDTAFTSGNTLYSEYYYSESLTYTYEGILYGNTSGYLYTIKNSVFTEADEYMSRVHYNVSIKFENSYVAGHTAASITGISVSEISQSKMLGASAKDNMPDLDWTAWILTDSYPVIAALHDLTYTNTGDSGHTVTCGDCDLSISLELHNYNSNYVCTLCAFAHSHTLVDDGIDYDATCVDDGVMNVKCEYCDYTSTREICAKNHIFGEVIAATAGDCQTEATVAYKICSACELCFTSNADITSTNPLDHIGTGYTGRHDWVAQSTIESTCTGGKDVEYFKCSVCNTYLVEGVMTDVAPSKADGHSLKEVTANDATCTAEGNIAYYECENCDKLFADAEGKTEIQLADTVVNAINHKNKVHHAANAADCLNDGNIEYWYCPDCNANYSDEACTTATNSITTAATGHTFGNVVAATDGDCENDGTIAYKTCSGCRLNFAEDAEADEETALETLSSGVKGEHSWIAQEALESKCTEAEDLAYDKCSVCEKYRADGEISDNAPTANGHTKGEAETVEPTETEDGSETVKCSACGETISTKVLPATGKNTDTDNVIKNDGTDNNTDKPADNNSTSNNESGDTESPKTTDNMSVIWIALLLAAGIGTTTIGIKTKNHN